MDWGKEKLTVGETQQKVIEYNAQTNSNLYMEIVSEYEITLFNLCAFMESVFNFLVY